MSQCEIYQIGPGTTQTHHQTIHYSKKIVNTLPPGLCGYDPLTTISLPQLVSVLRHFQHK